jgi:hypothetical protein
MSLVAVFTPVNSAHPSRCDYEHLFAFVPGDTGNPCVALRQAKHVRAVVLLVAGVLLLWLGGSRARIARRLG